MTGTQVSEQPVRGGTRRPRIKHADNPDAPGTALCGAKLSATPASAAGERCIVCRDLARRSYFIR